jgi:hypothetical protein
MAIPAAHRHIELGVLEMTIKPRELQKPLRTIKQDV